MRSKQNNPTKRGGVDKPVTTTTTLPNFNTFNVGEKVMLNQSRAMTIDEAKNFPMSKPYLEEPYEPTTPTMGERPISEEIETPSKCFLLFFNMKYFL